MRKTVRWIAILLLLAVVCHFTSDQYSGKILHVQQEVQGENKPIEQDEPPKEERIIDPNKPMIALTFDDGPGKYTDDLLDILEKYDAKATFFLTGTEVKKYPKSILRMQSMGCEIGNHTEQHKDLAKLKKKDIKTQVKKTKDKIEHITGDDVTLVRPPYGSIDKQVKEATNAPLILWSIDTNDWKKKDAKKITKYMKKYVKDGDVVLLHDIHKFTVKSMETVIPYLVKEGYQLVTVSEMAEARGVKLKAGKKYFDFKR